MTEIILPRTRIPCLFPEVKPGHAVGVVQISVASAGPASLAFADTLRALFGTTGEFAFWFEDRSGTSAVWVDGLDDDPRAKETLKTFAGDVDVELDSEAKISNASEEDALTLEEGILFHLQVRPQSLALVYSALHIPENFARLLLELYIDNQQPHENTTQKAAVAESYSGLSVLNHPPRAHPDAEHTYTRLYEGFLSQAKSKPDIVAVDFLDANGDRSTLTYSELDKKSFALARFLSAKRKTVIPLALPPSAELYVAYLGVLRSGNAFCPLPDAPAERVVELVGDVAAEIVLGLGPKPSWMDALPHVAWKDLNDDLEADVGEATWDEPKEDDLAYVLFTSGSTGKPKGVQITHLAVSASIASHLSVRALPAGTRWFQFAASTFDPSVMEIFMNFSSGTTICAANRSRFLTDPEAALRELECTHMMATPSMAAMLKPENIGDKFELWTMGEKLLDRVIDAFSRPEKGYTLYNAYGPTEAAINVTLRMHPRNESGARLGAPIPSATMVILHPTEGRFMPLGFPGELGLAGVQLAKGYLNMPQQTEKAFVQVEGFGRVYRTGDRARVVVDESDKWTGIEYLGRMGMGQVKLAGRRIELGEIDAVLSAVPGITAAHAVVLNEQLYALVTPASDELIKKAEQVAEARLPLHMRPVSYFLANSTPQSTAGKADRRAIAKFIASCLAEAVSADDDSDSAADPKTIELVIKLIAQTAELDEKAISGNVSLLSLGIDSLRGVRFLRLARDAGVQGLEIQDILGRATPVTVARVIAERQGHHTAPATTLTHHKLIEDFVPQASASVRRELGLSEDDALPEILPATPMQASVLAVYLRTPERSTGYLNHSVYTLSTHVQVEPFKRAWEEVVQRNAILRTFFVLVDDSDISPFAQVVDNNAAVRWNEAAGADVDASVAEYLDQVPAQISLRSPSAVALISNEDKTDARFVLTLHHSLFDGGSLALMLEELYSIYNEAPERPQRASFEHGMADVFNANVEACTAYWSDELKDFTPDYFPDLSGLRQDAKAPGHHVSTIMSRSSFTNVRDQARAIQTTPLSAIQAAWGIILLTYSESESPDIVFGSVIGGRTSEDLEFTVGPVFSTVPVRLRDVENSSTKDVLSGLLDKNVSSLLNRYPPVKVLSGEKGIIYDTTIALQNFGQGLSQTELWTKAEYPAMETEFAVVLEIWVEQDDSIRLRATCSNNVLIPSASEAMLRQFDDILHGVLNGEQQDRALLEVTSTVDTTLLSSVNPTPIPQSIPSTKLIHHEFEENARTHPDALALWFKPILAHPECDIRWTYRELNARANRLANYLVSTFGDLRDQAVPICMEKCPELYVAILGIVKAGGAWCPVDAEAPDKRKSDLFSRAGGPVVLVRDRRALAELVAARPDGLVMFALDDARLAEQSEEAPVVETGSSHLAYLIWTSGTTGLPKGVPIEHSAAVQSLTTLQEEIPFKHPGVRALNFSAYTFDVSVLDIYYALGQSCGTLCSAPKDILVSQFVEVVNAFEATHAFLTPAFMAQSSLAECSTLQSLISIGEKLPDSVADKWSRPGTVSLNTYGPAEATIIATYRRFQPGEATKAQNVGLPIQTVSCFAMKNGLLVPRGAVGELALGGYQNARGYHRQPDMTAKKFINHPVAGKVYMTGDIVRFLHDGTCEFVGRNDDLVKLGGIRVELSEISAVLKSSHPLVQDATTIQLARPDRPQKVVCTFLAAPSLVSEFNLCTDSKAVEVACAGRDSAEQYLPAFMHPTVIIVLKTLPLTPSNKVDRRALLDAYVALDISTWETAVGGVMTDSGPWSATEAKIQAIVSELTGSPMEWIKKTTPFPALGVDSLRALQLASRLRKADIAVSVRDILMHASAAKLGRCVDRAKTAPSSDVPAISEALQRFEAIWKPVVECDIDSAARVLPCTPLQEGMLGETVKNPGAYWSHRLFVLEGDVDVKRLEKAWEVVAARTEVLRAVYLPAAAYTIPNADAHSLTVFLQVLLAAPSIQFSVLQCSKLELAQHSAERAEKVNHAWTDSRLPPWGVTIFDHGDEGQTMLLSMHHALYDGSAIFLLLDDVQNAYHGKPLKDRVQLTEALSASLFAQEPGKSQAFWEDVLTPFADPDAGPWPTLLDRVPTAEEKSRFLSSSFVLDRNSTTETATSLGVSIGNVLQAAWSAVLSAYMDTSKVVFGETLSLRIGNAALEQAIAPLITTTPVLAMVTDTTTPRALVEELSRLASRSAEHRLVSLQRVRKALKRQINQPVFSAIFVMFNEDDETTDGSAGGVERLWTGWTDVMELGVEHPLAVNVYVGENEIKINVLGSGRFMLEDQIGLLGKQFEAVLGAMAMRPDEPFGSLLAELDEGNLSVLMSSREVTELAPTHWLEKRALMTPDAVAFSVHGLPSSSWTYKALDEASNRVAAWIQERYQSCIVAYSMTPSQMSIVYQLGIFKSGNIYLPIDESIPPTRKRLLIRSTKATVVLTTSLYEKDFADVEGLCVVDAEHPEHVEEVQSSSASKLNQPIAEVACMLFSHVQRTTSKACKISSRGIASMVEALAARIGCTVSSDGKFMSWMPSAFETSLVELFLPIRLGMTNIAVSHTTFRGDFVGLTNELGGTHTIIPPGWLQKQGVRVHDVPTMRCVLLTGPILRHPVLQESPSEFTPMVLAAFGFPETTSICALAFNRPAPVRMLGTLLDHTDAVVLRVNSSAVALRGSVGELCVGGESVSTGYVRGPPTRFVETKYGRFFRTGTLVRVLANNSIQHVGQDQTASSDLSTMSRTVQNASPQSLNAYTLPLNHPEGVQKYVVSFVSRSWDPLEADIPSFSVKDSSLANSLFSLIRRLPAPHIPDVILPIDTIPFANVLSQEVDIKTLTRLFSRSSPDTLRHPDETEVRHRALSTSEEQIRLVLSLATGVPEDAINATTSTLELGVDSLTAISLSFRLKAAGFFIPPHVILGGPSLEVLARASCSSTSIKKTIRLSVDSELRDRVFKEVDANRVVEIRPCLPLQEGLVARTFNSPVALYVNHFTLRLGAVDISRLCAAFTDTVNANDILRTCFFAGDAEIVQVVLKDAPSLWNAHVVSSGKDPLESLRAHLPLVEEDIVQNMSKQSPIRLSIYSSPVVDELSYLCVTMHHAIYDGESLPMILSEVRERYDASFQTIRPPMNRLLDYLAYQSLDAARVFFVNYLLDAPRPATTFTVTSAHRQRLVVDLPLSSLEQASRALNVSLHSLVMTAYGIALGEYRKNTDSVFGVVLSGRAILLEGIETLLAPCITTVPVRVHVKTAQSFADLACQTQAELSSVFEHQHTPLRLIQRWTGSAQSSGTLFDTLFSYTKRGSKHTDHGLWTSLESDAVLDYPLAVAVEAATDSDTLTLLAGHDLIFASIATVARLLSRVSDLLSDVHQTIACQTPSEAMVGASNSLEPVYDSATWSNEERTIQRAVAEICNVDLDIVSKDTSFLHLGIDSITSIRLAQRLRSADLEVPTYAIMQNSCVGALAQFIFSSVTGSVSEIATREFQSLQSSLAQRYLTSIPLLSDTDTITSVYPATPLQVGMLTQSISSGGSMYFVHHGLLLNPDVSVSGIRSAWEKVIANTDILRSSFLTSSDPEFPWIGAIHEQAPIQWKETQVPSEEELRRLARDIESQGSLDDPMFSRPPIRFHAISSPGMTILIATMHHCLYDGLSFSYILEDVAAAYHKHDNPTRPQFTDAVPFILYSSKDESHFWETRLLGYVASALPKIAIAPAEPRESTIETNAVLPTVAAPGSLNVIQTLMQVFALLTWGKTFAAVSSSINAVFGSASHRSIEATAVPSLPMTDTSIHLARHRLSLPPGSLDDIKKMGVTVQAVALLAWGKTLATLLNSVDVVFGQVVAGRSIELHDSLRASGPLFNTIPFRFTLDDPNLTNLEAVKAQHALNVSAEAHQHVPLRRIQRDWRMSTASREALFETLFVFQQASAKSSARSALWSAFSISEEGSSAQYPISVEVVHSGEFIEFRAGCQASALSEADLQDTLETLAQAFMDIVTQPLESVVAYPSSLKRLASLPISRAAPVASQVSMSEREPTVVEEKLRKIFSVILNLPVDKIGLSTPLYALGLDSVAAIQIAAKCRSDHGLDIAVADIFVGETITGVGEAYEARTMSDGAHDLRDPMQELISVDERSQALALLKTDQKLVQDVLPVLPGQLYHLSTWLMCGATFYQPVFVYKATKPVDAERLSEAWELLLAQHSVLRTVFAAVSPSTVVQVVLAEGSGLESGLEVVDLDGNFDQRVKEQVRLEYHTPSNLFTPPARAKMVRVGEECALLLSLHHSTYDAWSVPRLISDLCSLYDGTECKTAPDFSAFVRHIAIATDVSSTRDFWRDTVKSSSTSSFILPRKHDSPDLKQVFVRASGLVGSADELHTQCQAAGSSLQAVVLAVWGRIAKRLTQAQSPVVGVYHTGRAASFEGLEVLAGPCVNILPMQIPAPDDMGSAARYIQEQLGKRTRYEQTALRNIIEWVDHAGPLFNIFVNLLWHGDKIRSLRSSGTLLESYSVGAPSEYASEEPFELHTSIDALDCSYLPNLGMYVDVVLNAQTNSLGLAIRCNEALLDESELNLIVSEFADGVKAAVSELE